MDDSLTLGRQPGSLAPPFSGEDHCYASQRLDDTKIDGATFAHCTFTNISFKNAEITDSTFRDCIFIDCYFRKARLFGSEFTSCRFIDCSFPKAEVRGNDFRYAKFRRCVIPFSEMSGNLPQEFNLKRDLAFAMERASLELLETREASLFRQEGIKAHESHLKHAFKAQGTYYQKHFDGLGRAKAFVDYFASRVNGQLWGHGERWTRLARNFLILALLAFPALNWWLRGHLVTTVGTPPTGLAPFLLSLDRIFVAGNVTGISATSSAAQAALIGESTIGIVLIGLFIAIFVKAISRR